MPDDGPRIATSQVAARLILTGGDYVEISRIEVADGSLTLSGRYLQ